MKKVVLVFLVLVSVTLQAQKTPTKLIEEFFVSYKTNPSKAVRDLYKTNKWMDRKKDDVEKVISTINGFNKEYVGEYYGYEHITTKKFAKSFELDSYLVKYDRQPIRFIFKFYKPNKDWILYAFSFDDSFDAEIQEAAKLYYLDLEEK